ncbi:MAG TPA: DUF3467 domain-containing protein [Propionibacteriaceae bacterium]|nr:DUF3467 domain-containing protein [Propionibacteriaceae bacterium]
MTDTPPPPARTHQIELPAEHVVGVPADYASVWHTPESFVLDFLAARGPAQVGEHEGHPVVVQDLVVSARVRMPPTHVIELMKALERQLSIWETETGRRPPVDPSLPPL